MSTTVKDAWCHHLRRSAGLGAILIYFNIRVEQWKCTSADALSFLPALKETGFPERRLYEGVLAPDICAAMGRVPVSVSVESIGVPHKVLSRYGTPEEHDEELGLTNEGIRRRVERFLSE